MVNRTLCALALIVMASMALAATAGPKSFASPEAGITALVEAVKVNDQPTLRAILGPHGGKLIRSGDAVADRPGRGAFLQAHGAAHKLGLDRDRQTAPRVRPGRWPMPIAV